MTRSRPVLALALLALPLLGGCAALSVLDGAAQPLAVYELRSPDGAAAHRGTLPLDVIVETPETSGALATDRIMIRPDPLQAQYLPGARWSDPAPEMLQTLMLRSLADTGALRYVGRRPLAANGDFAVLTELIDFHAEAPADAAGAVVRLRIIVRLVREEDARIVATRSFSASAAAPSTETGAVVEAFDRAATELLAGFRSWVIDSLAARS